MSKHVRVPAPIQKVIPRIIRSTGGRLVLIGGSCAALLALGGSHYLLSRTVIAPGTHKTTPTKAPSDAKVLGSATTEHLDEAVPAASTAAPTPAATVAPTAPPVTRKNVMTKAVQAASFEIEVDPSQITRSRTSLLLTIPFEIERHGNLTTPIVPGEVSVTSGGLLISVEVQSQMTGSDKGYLTILPIGIRTGKLNVHFSASSGDIMASTSFSYRL